MQGLSIKSKFLPYLLLLPAFLLILIFKIYPIIRTFTDAFIVNSHFSLQAYTTLFGDPTIWNSLGVTLKINIIMIPLQIILSFILALLVNVTLKGIGLFRTIFYLPVTVSLTIAVLLWSMMMDPSSGVLNSFLNLLGISQQSFLQDKNEAIWCIVVIATWKGCGYWMMFFLAGLKSIDNSIYEAAKIDGATFLQTIFRITIPLMKDVSLFVMVANTTANLLLFIPMQMVTQGGPEGSTDVLMYEAYKSAFMYINPSRSAAIISILLVLVVAICAFQFIMMSDKKDETSGEGHTLEKA
jgi:ABC-type sugar transport system permease subunit